MLKIASGGSLVARYTTAITHMKLFDLKITQAEFDTIIDSATFATPNEWKYLPVGTFFKAKDGHVCRIVKAGDLFCDQVGGAVLSLPEIGLQHWRPVIITTSEGSLETVLTAR